MSKALVLLTLVLLLAAFVYMRRRARDNSDTSDGAPAELAALIDKTDKWDATPHERSGKANLERLMRLSTTSAIRDNVPPEGPKEIARRCIESTHKVRTYQSDILITDFTQENLKPRNFLAMRWELDSEKPDRVQVKQTGWMTTTADQESDWWITLGTEHYTRAGLWVRTGENTHQKLDSFLQVEKYTRVLETATPVEVVGYRFDDARYVFLRFRFEDLGSPTELQGAPLIDVRRWIDSAGHEIGEFNGGTYRAFGGLKYDKFRGVTGRPEDRWNGPGELRLWIDLATHRISKAEILALNREVDEKMDVEVFQAFAAYDEPSQIQPPPQDIVLRLK